MTRQAVSNPCYTGDHDDCGLHAPDGKPCACDCHKDSPRDMLMMADYAAPFQTIAQPEPTPAGDATDTHDHREIDWYYNPIAADPSDRGTDYGWLLNNPQMYGRCPRLGCSVGPYRRSEAYFDEHNRMCCPSCHTPDH